MTRRMVQRVWLSGLQISSALYEFIAREALPGTGVEAGKFWSGFAALAARLMPQNRASLAELDRLQAAIVF